MAKRKRKEQEPAQIMGDAQEPASTTPADLSGPWDEAPEAPAGETVEQPGKPKDEPAGQPPTVQRTERKPRSVMGRYFPGKKVELIDDGNTGGVGIKLSYDDPSERPSDAVKQILKDGDDKRPGFTYRGDKSG